MVWPTLGSRTAKEQNRTHTHTHTHTHPFNGPFSGTTQVKPIWILLKQETVSGSDISWAICKSAPCSRQTTTPAPHHSVFNRPDALPAAQPTASKHSGGSKKPQFRWLLGSPQGMGQLGDISRPIIKYRLGII